MAVSLPKAESRKSDKLSGLRYSFLPSLLVGQHHQLYLGLGADIVMESISAQGKGEVYAKSPHFGLLGGHIQPRY